MIEDLNHQVDVKRAAQKELDALKAQLDAAINAYDGCAVERDDLKSKLARAKALHFQMCRASLDAEGMAVSERAIKAIWDREVDIMEMDK